MQLNAGSRKRAALDEGRRECNIWASIRLPTPSILGAEGYRCPERLHIILSGGHASTAESHGWFRRSFGRLRVNRRVNVTQKHIVPGDKPSNESEDLKGPLGLQLLRTVPEPLVDFIFIHGLGGGSRKTWSKSPDPYHYWPKEWLSQDPEFDKVRTYSFGYKADWAETTASVLNIYDFALSLLGEIQCNPDIRRSNVSRSPIFMPSN
ncbi:hypothetical protein AAWM_08890 [Aspergillus awamori]|uniref:Protein SERAC1 n=1 Tax=Aspergillus awamori TaxID=105351 RepID=A0A401L3B4_ASPAW|nr:hypothetical protein AAWM_08890 [Aspergillus awamori]